MKQPLKKYDVIISNEIIGKKNIYINVIVIIIIAQMI